MFMFSVNLIDAKYESSASQLLSIFTIKSYKYFEITRRPLWILGLRFSEECQLGWFSTLGLQTAICKLDEQSCKLDETLHRFRTLSKKWQLPYFYQRVITYLAGSFVLVSGFQQQNRCRSGSNETTKSHAQRSMGLPPCIEKAQCQRLYIRPSSLPVSGLAKF